MEKPTLAEELELLRRGTVDIFPEAEFEEKIRRSRATGRPLRVKLGVDATGPQLHLGHIIPVLKLRQFQELGHQAVLIVGDYTAMVGDPSGRNQARPQLPHAAVMENARTLAAQAFVVLDPEHTEVVYNGSWFSQLTFQDTVRLMAGTTVARILEREDFTTRFQGGNPIGLHELLYPLMQAYDSLMVRADVELGAIDQKFNILAGRDLQKAMGQEPQVGVCGPLLIGTDGVEKMGKSLGNFIGVTEPPPEMYGKVMSIPDTLIASYGELLTSVAMDQIHRWEEEMRQGKVNPRDVKRRLAREIVTRFHGREAARAAEEHFDRVHIHKDLPAEIPEVEIAASSIWIARLLVQAGLAPSHAEARRLVQQGGVKLDGQAVAQAEYEWPVRSGAVLQVGKRRFVRIVVPGRP
ncbi:MAG TPA: tyrosine--tRNA ligase [Clostridiales bacterium UBA8153]|nr:tyrosine--tRNA ligase [Clostridiales bacterium UBA8153]